ncbi:MAG: zonular occludens toxin domain-containing protein [Desulfobulbus sp.]|jgi:zona occludens toxin (predicted ATPase)|uniref:zonular occludens toxin domain-containing protein n=1 Tax=Desulfobulbus sp. TaxID=895 RepID=UPI00283B7F37|nr:zonular occludens toxin domain-containing protein [Desulfobulbus sp.]MDR2549467.1 zonular occludens toxin domain-containing protein [Desulfobulbus sp.]
MIIGFAGTPGSGKTYEAVRKILDNLQQGRVVFTNIDGMSDPLCLEMIKSYCELSDLALLKQLHFLEPHQLEDFWMHVAPGSLVVLDEVQKVFSSREWQTAKNNAFASWASTHRHNGFDVVLITQAIERIDSAVRSLLEWTYVFRKVNFFGSAVSKKYLCYSYAGDDTGGEPLKKSVRTYNPSVFRCYKSYTSKDVKELGIMQHVNVLKHPIFFAIPIVLCFTLYMLFAKSSIGSGDLFGSQAAMTSFQQIKSKQEPAKEAKGTPPATRSETIAPTDRGGQIVFTNRR